MQCRVTRPGKSIDTNHDSQVGPIVSGAMADNVGWRSFWWLNVGLLGAATLMSILLFPETRYHRLHPEEIRHNAMTTKSIEETPISAGVTSTEKPEMSTREDVENIERVPTFTTLPPSPVDLTLTETAARDPHLGKGTPGRWQWRIFQPNAHPFKTILLDLWIPWKLFAFPIVEFASFVVSWSCSSFLTINLTQSQAFAAPPYNFSAQAIGKWSSTPFLLYRSLSLGLSGGC